MPRRSAWVSLLIVVGCNHSVPAIPPAIDLPIPAAGPPTAAPEPGPCEKLAALSLPHVTITSVRSFPAATASDALPALPASCRVQGSSHPTADSDIRFEVAIPVGGAWNGRYLQVGNGGFAGTIREPTLMTQLAAGYASAGTDDGHQSPRWTDATWALGHPEKVIDFGYRALQETTDAARAVIRAYTGRAPLHSYFVGCSDGGREALMEAQRYPDDFDGVVAGAPANKWTRLFAGGAWIVQALEATPQSYVPAPKLRAVEAAALKACGDEDRVIEDPLACRFDAGVLRCKGADNDDCLTEAQVKAVRAIYTGPRVPGTKRRIASGFEPGSEAEEDGWRGWLIGTAPGSAGGAAYRLFTDNFLRYMVFEDPSYDVRHFRMDTDVATTDAKLGPILNSDNPDLTAFQKHGGKLIQYHGWSDAAVPPRKSVSYYEAVQAKMGDTAGFYRLFMAPGMFHCRGGAGPSVLATVPAIADWVENGRPPDRLLATKMSGAEVIRTRPLCPYPQQARWDGKGDKKRAESFTCLASRPRGR